MVSTYTASIQNIFKTQQRPQTTDHPWKHQHFDQDQKHCHYG